MALLKQTWARLRGDHLGALSAEVAQLRQLILELNHRVTEVHEIVQALNHDVRAGADSALPLFLGHAEQLRADAETAISASLVIERQLARLDERLAKLSASADG